MIRTRYDTIHTDTYTILHTLYARHLLSHVARCDTHAILGRYVNDTLMVCIRYAFDTHDTSTVRARYARYAPDTRTILIRYAHDTIHAPDTAVTIGLRYVLGIIRYIPDTDTILM